MNKYKKNNLKKLKVAIFGGGFDSTISKTHLRAILATNKFKVVCGMFSEKKVKNYKNSVFWRIPLNRIYNNLDILLDKELKNFDIAVILTPPNNRYKIYKKLFENNKKIISEKPIEGNVKILAKNFFYLKRLEKNFYCTYNYLGYPSIMEIKDQLRKIGKIKSFIIEMPQQASLMNFDKIKKWRKKDFEIPNLYLDLASHIICLSYFFFQKFPKAVKSIEQINNKIGYVDNVFAWLDYKGFYGTCWFSKNSIGNKNKISIRIYGEKGSLKWDHENHENIDYVDLQGNKKILDRTTRGLKHLNQSRFYTYSPGHPFGFLDSFINIYEEIYKTFKTGTKSNILIGVKENVNILNILNQMHKSSKTSKWHKIKLIR